jgi:hypothetical protein
LAKRIPPLFGIACIKPILLAIASAAILLLLSNPTNGQYAAFVTLRQADNPAKILIFFAALDGPVPCST